MERWTPAMREAHYDRRPPVGRLVAHRRQPWRVIAVHDVPSDEWTEQERDAWLDERMPDPWRRRPFLVDVEDPQGTPGRMRVGPQHTPTWHVLPEHYAVCVSCGELAPCIEHTSMIQAQRVMERVERDMRTLPGCCPACQEPITRRQESVTFTGENLLVPLGAPDPTYHLRNACRSGAARYEEMWVKADPTRPRSLLTLSCEGGVIVHHDGSAECHGAPDCPSVHARHRYYAACYTQSAGCGRGCPAVGHPGCAVRRNKTGIRP